LEQCNSSYGFLVTVRITVSNFSIFQLVTITVNLFDIFQLQLQLIDFLVTITVTDPVIKSCCQTFIMPYGVTKIGLLGLSMPTVSNCQESQMKVNSLFLQKFFIHLQKDTVF